MKLYSVVTDEDKHPYLKCMADDHHDEWSGDGVHDSIESAIRLTVLNEQMFETSVTIALGEDGKPLGCCVTSIGSQVQCDNNTDVMILFLALIGAKKYIDLHNYPLSQIPEPSDPDLEVYEYLDNLGDSMGIRFEEGMVVTKNSWLIMPGEDGCGDWYFIGGEKIII